MTEQNADRMTLVVCPICQAQKFFEIPGYVLKQESAGIIKIQIHNPSVCEHDFVTFVDHTGKVRGYELIDYQLQFTSRTGKKHTAVEKLFLEDLLETLGNFATLSVFHAFLFNYRVLIITGFAEIPKYVDLLNDLFARIFPPEVPVDNLARVIDQHDFIKLNVGETDHLIVDTKGMVSNTPWGDWKRFDFESEVVKKALAIIDANAQAQFIQQEVGKLLKWVEFLLAILEEGDVVYEKEVIKKLSAGFGMKVTNYHLDLCKLFVARRIPSKAPLLERVRDKSLDILKKGFW